MHRRPVIARAATLLLFLSGAGGAAHAVTVTTTMPGTSTWVTFYQAGASWVGLQANSGCIAGGKGEMRAEISANEFYVRTQVMASNDCKGTQICDTQMRVSGRDSKLFVNQTARDAKNCFISDKDQSGDAYVGPAMTACLTNLRSLASQVDAARARGGNEIDATEAARYKAARDTTLKALGLAPLNMATLGQCRSDTSDLQKLQKVLASMSKPLPGPAVRQVKGSQVTSAITACERDRSGLDRQLTTLYIAHNREGRLGRIGEAEFSVLRDNVETVWKERVAKHGATSRHYSCDERASLLSDLLARLNMIAN